MGVSQLTRAVSQKSVVERGVLLVIGVRFLFARKAVLPAVRGMDKSGISASRWRRGQVGPQQHTVLQGQCGRRGQTAVHTVILL